MGAGTPTSRDIARAVARATAAGLPVADVELRGTGVEFEPSRGQPGMRYAAHEIVIRELTQAGSGALDAGISLYPPPPADVRRIIVLPLDGGNWLPFSEQLEHVVVQVAQEPGSAADT